MLQEFEIPSPADVFDSANKAKVKGLNSNDASLSTVSTRSISEILPISQMFFGLKYESYFFIPIIMTDEYLFINDDSNEKILMEDILGVTVKKSKVIGVKTSSQGVRTICTMYKLKIYLLKHKRKILSEGELSKRKYQKREYYSDSETVANQWKNLILHAANNPDFGTIKTTCSFEELPCFQRKLLVFISPKSGSNKGEKNWKKAKKLLEKAGCQLVEIYTQYSGYAKEYIRAYDPDQLKMIDGFVTVSGDGVLHEIINGLFQRPDWKDFSNKPFGIIPSGTSNALIKNMLDKEKETVSLKTSCYLIAKGRTLKSDLTMLEKEDGSKIFSFLIFAWATMAAIDVGSNDFRAFGKLRFVCCGIYNLVNLKKYHAKLTYSTEDRELPNINEEIKEEGWQNCQSGFGHFSLHNLPWIGSKHQAVPLADFQDGVNHFLALEGDNVSRKKLSRTFSKLNGRLFKEDKPKPKFGLTYEKMKAFRIEPNGKNVGYYAIDGEAYKATKIQGKVLEKSLTLYCLKNMNN